VLLALAIVSLLVEPFSRHSIALPAVSGMKASTDSHRIR
jgi:hypothetical protein